MIRSSNHSSYPRIGDNPLDQQVRAVLRARSRGAATDADVVETHDEVTTIAVAEQSRAFIDVVSDGMVRWDGPTAHLARHLDGLETGELRRWFGTNFYEPRVVVVGEIRRSAAFLVHDFEVAKSVAQKPVKVTLPGPVTFARLARDEHYRDLDRLADALAEALAIEVGALVEAGTTCFQLDEPLLCRHPEDLERVSRTAAAVFDKAGAAAMTIVSTYFGDLTALSGRLGELPGTHVGLEVLDGGANLSLLADLPQDKGVALGLFDARTTRQEDAADVAARLEPHKESLTCRDVLVGPNAGLELLPRDQAFDKLLHSRYLVEKLSGEWTWAS